VAVVLGAAPERVAADETKQPGLDVRICRHLYPGAELAGGTENLLDLLHLAQELGTEGGVQSVILAGSPR